MLNTRESIKFDLMDMRRALAAFDVQVKAIRLAHVLRKYSPDQPRVPAGLPEGGQWTSGGGGGGGGDSGEGDGDAQIELVQGDRLQGYPVDLREDERLGGHTISDHVGKSDAFLKLDVLDRARRIIEDGGDFRGLAVSSFPSLDPATRLVNSTLSQNREMVDLVASGEARDASVWAEFASPTGYQAYLPGPNSLPYMRDVYGVRAYIVWDPRSSRGYRVHSAYPANY
jgi:Bacterial CdiA-CT RNAse A domain